jgi:mannose-1-phosphate guanylyltransferase
MKAIILAGGVGTRLWPLSRSDKPKQFTNLITDEPLLKDTYRRLLRGMEAEKIYFSTSLAFAPMILEILPDVAQRQIIIEPEKRDTCSAMGYAAAVLELESPDEPVIFVPSDHYVRDEEKFLECVRVAGLLVEKTGRLLDIAVTAEFPSTVLGYTKIGKLYDDVDGVKVFNFAGHTEKPSYELAKKYLEDGTHLWHANYYTWTPRAFMNAIEVCAPNVGLALREIQEALKRGDVDSISEIFSAIEPASFDYAVTEKLDKSNVLIIKGDFGWSDVGAWDTLYARLAEDTSQENVLSGDAVVIDSRGNLVRTSADKLIALVGVENLVVVDTDDALLVTTHSHAQRVKEVIAELESRNAKHLL